MFQESMKLFLGCSLAALLLACGGGESGWELGAEGGNEHGAAGESGDEGGSEDDATVAFVSSGVSLGIFESAILLPDEAYAGLLHDSEVAISYDPAGRRFVGRMRNEATAAVCDVRVAVELDGYLVVNRTPSGEAYAVDGLRPYDRADFEFPLDPGVQFTEWLAAVETFECASAPAGTGGGGGEGSGEHGADGEGSEGSEGSEGDEGSEGSEGSESGEGGEGGEDAATIPIMETASGTFGSAEYSFAYDMQDMAFRGTVHNPTADLICGSKTEIHMGIGTQLVELGPTIPQDLPAGETIKVVMTASAYMPDTYSVHPEYSQCL